MNQKKRETNRMGVKRYVADDMRQALKMIRDELGPDAVILSNRRVPGGVEILTTLAYDDSLLSQAPDLKPSNQPNDTEQTQAATADAGANEPPASAFEQLLNQYQQPATKNAADEELMAAMRSEIESLRLLLKDQMSHMNQENWCARNPIEAAVLKRFDGYRINDKVARSIARQVSVHLTIEEGWQAALDLLEQQIPIVAADQWQEGVVALLGPTGAGKTTTIAKLAVRYALRYGRENLALVTTDRYRLAAYEQLKALGRIIDVPVRLVDEQTSLDKVLRSLRHKSMVLIDTAGFHTCDRERRQQLDELRNARADIKTLLVLPCTSHDEVLRAAYGIVERSQLTGCILSKADEVAGFGEVLSLAVEKALPVAYITNGQAIPDDIESATAEALIGAMRGESGKAKMMGITPSDIIKSAQPPAVGMRIGR